MIMIIDVIVIMIGIMIVVMIVMNVAIIMGAIGIVIMCCNADDKEQYIITTHNQKMWCPSNHEALGLDQKSERMIYNGCHSLRSPHILKRGISKLHC